MREPTTAFPAVALLFSFTMMLLGFNGREPDGVVSLRQRYVPWWTWPAMAVFFFCIVALVVTTS